RRSTSTCGTPWLTADPARGAVAARLLSSPRALTGRGGSMIVRVLLHADGLATTGASSHRACRWLPGVDGWCAVARRRRRLPRAAAEELREPSDGRRVPELHERSRHAVLHVRESTDR